MSDVENIADHMALTCHCGSVRFCLLRSGRVECASCQDRPGVAWHQHDDPAQCVGEVIEIDEGDDESGPHAWIALHNPVAIGTVLMRAPMQDDTSECKECCGNGWNDVWRKVTGHYQGGEVFREECDACNGKGQV